MAFMQIETEYGAWLLVEVNGSTEYVPPGCVNLGLEPGQEITESSYTEKGKDFNWADVADQLRDYVEERCTVYTLDSVECRVCWGARYSAPGYMDCTDWCLGDTEEEAVAECKEIYGDDEEDEVKDFEDKGD